MDERELLTLLLDAEKVEEVKAVLTEYRQASDVSLIPFGRRDNNRGAIDVATDAARSAIERVTNAHDAILEYEHAQHAGLPKSDSPREAAAHWLGVPMKGGLSALSPGKRQELAADTIVRLEPGEGSQSRLDRDRPRHRDRAHADGGDDPQPEREQQDTALSRRYIRPGRF